MAEQISKEKVSRFYDDFIENQAKSGINQRIFSLFQRLKNHGLKKNSRVLELGCGIGTLTFLLAKYCRNGKIEAADLSGKSVEFARKNLSNFKNISFKTADIVHYRPEISAPDFITLFDIIEHIPLELHPQLFQNLEKICGPSTKILINIPNPDYIDFDRKNFPERLQIIDQPIPIETIIRNLNDNNLELFLFETYSIWVEDDYQFMLIRKKSEFSEIPVNKNFKQKIKNRLKIFAQQTIHKFPRQS